MITTWYQLPRIVLCESLQAHLSMGILVMQCQVPLEILGAILAMASKGNKWIQIDSKWRLVMGLLSLFSQSDHSIRAQIWVYSFGSSKAHCHFSSKLDNVCNVMCHEILPHFLIKKLSHFYKPIKIIDKSARYFRSELINTVIIMLLCVHH